MRTTDPIDLVRAYAPSGDRPVSEELLQRAFQAAPPRRRGRRGIVAAGAALAVLGAGGAVAVAGPPTWNRVFGPTAPADAQHQADPATAQKVFTAPGPDGQEFAAWTIRNDVGWRCIATFLEPVGTTEAPDGLTSGSGSSGCILAKPLPPGLFVDGDSGNSPDPDDRLSFVWEAGDAARAVLKVDLPDGDSTVLPITVDNGWLGGWYSISQVPLGSRATVIAYGANGAELARRVDLDQSGCSDPGGC